MWERTDISTSDRALGSGWIGRQALLEGPYSREARSLKDTLDQGPGYAVLKGFPLEGISGVGRDELYVRALSQLGSITLHGGTQEPIWRVSPQVHSEGRERTFSELADEAPLHTDSAFLERPEKYFSLLVVRPAQDGGCSVVLEIETLLRAFTKTSEGREAMFVLRDREFPFATPAAFQRGNQASSNVILAPILGEDPRIRFRYDCVRAGFALRPDLASADRVQAVERFNDFLKPYLDQTGLPLERGDLFIGNNHRILHARKAFQDPQRLLLRMRMAP